ncbi:Glycoside hydrolase family 16 protein [Rutstroemia sp. NJR-2017a BVV2]|nr:Glycoside hydrolase family 16 protein [Rutstroemia sp. NJR-2017a BVV2]
MRGVDSQNWVSDDLKSLNDSCSCGFLDAATGNLFTESLIIYFNETNTVLDDFILQSYENKYEKDYNSVFRQGSNPVNIKLFNNLTNDSEPEKLRQRAFATSFQRSEIQSSTHLSHRNYSNPSSVSEPLAPGPHLGAPSNASVRSFTPSLKLSVEAPTEDHLVIGGDIRTLRQDIQYGSARAYLRPSDQGVGGSALTMKFQYNETQSMEMNIMNTNSNSTAWVTSLMGLEFPNPSVGTNFTTFDSENVSLFQYNEYRLDWTKDEARWYIGGILVRSVSKKNKSILSAPSPFVIKHWSTGNPYSMEGPPYTTSVASIGYIRLFFNSSTMNATEHVKFDSRCYLAAKCSMDDNSLRGSSPFSPAALDPWEQHVAHGALRWVAIWLSVACMTITISALLNALLRLKILKKKKSNAPSSVAQPTFTHSTSPLYIYSRDGSDTHAPSYRTRVESYTSDTSFPDLSKTFAAMGFPAPAARVASGIDSIDKIYADVDPHWDVAKGSSAEASSISFTVQEMPPTPPLSLSNSPSTSHLQSNTRNLARRSAPNSSLNSEEIGDLSNGSSHANHNQTDRGDNDKDIHDTGNKFSTNVSPSVPEGREIPARTSNRVDHLVGLITIAAISVTVFHFCLTFLPAIIVPGAPAHYSAERWLNKTIEPFLLNQGALGLFFTTSARFLVAPFLQSHDLSLISQKIVVRVFQIMLPVLLFVLLEYFLILSGATYYLPYLPSITWSTWPYVTTFPNIGHLLNEVLALAYLVPNAVPLITFNFCTGVLWTIPVIIQGSWTSLLAVLLVTSIPLPTRRFSFYFFCIGINWYAVSWSSYFWIGLLITDLEITYHMPSHLQKHPFVYYPLILLLSILALLSLSVDSFNQWFEYSLLTHEALIHPSPTTGLPLSSTQQIYPGYWTPHINGLIFCLTIHLLTSISPLVQRFLSLPHLIALFPHIFTLYLFHGMVFWSLGSYVCFMLNKISLPYWANAVTTAVVCYVVLFLCLPVLSLVAGLMGKDVAGEIRRDSVEEPVGRWGTLEPFGKDWLDKVGTSHSDAISAPMDDKQNEIGNRSSSEGKPQTSKPQVHTQEMEVGQDTEGEGWGLPTRRNVQGKFMEGKLHLQGDEITKG